MYVRRGKVGTSHADGNYVVVCREDFVAVVDLEGCGVGPVEVEGAGGQSATI